MLNISGVIKATGSGTTTIGSCVLYGISINKTTSGTVTVNELGSAVGQFAASTAPNTYHNIPAGVRYSSLTIVLSAGDDVTVFSRPA